MKLKGRRSPVENPLIRSYRELLGVNPGSSAEELKKAYRRLVLLYHPDKNPDSRSQEQFLKVTEAFEVLSNASRVQRLNQGYLEKKLFDQPVAGINVSFGSFFGYRTFSLNRAPKALRIGKEKKGEEDSDIGVFQLSYSDTNQSILDNPAFDSIELVFAGKFSPDDEERMSYGLKGREMGQLPWIVLNNKGIIAFLDGRFEEALNCYDELNKRIPNNIIFLYRLGLCHAILSFQKRKRSLLSLSTPDKRHLKIAVDSFRRAIAIGESRSIGKQKCFTIRKTLAEILEKAGERRLARKIWQGIRDLDPKSAEAAYRLRSRLTLLSSGRK